MCLLFAWLKNRLFPWHAQQWLRLLQTCPATERQWARYWRAYRMLYGYDYAPFWAHRQEWQYSKGVEIDQYLNGH